MDDTRNPLMPPEDNGSSSPIGGLASKAIGGLSTFLGNVNKGVDAVLSHPLYARAWSGLVSGMTGDPMAGPFALQQLQQSALNQRMQQQEMSIADENRRMQQRSMERSDLLHKQFVAAARKGDRTAMESAWAEMDPNAYAKYKMQPAPSRGAPIQAIKDGKPTWVYPDEAVGLQPVPRAPLVTVENGMKPDQVVAAEDRAAGRVDEKAKPLEIALDAYRSFRALAEQVAARGTPPTPAETDSLAKLAARLENPEAVQEGDIARKAGGSFANFFAGKAGLPYSLSLDQLSGLVSTADVIAGVKQRRLDEIYSGAKGVAKERGFNPEAITPGAQRIAPPQVNPPAGFKPHPTVPGLYVNDAGEGWVP